MCVGRGGRRKIEAIRGLADDFAARRSLYVFHVGKKKLFGIGRENGVNLLSALSKPDSVSALANTPLFDLQETI